MKIFNFSFFIFFYFLLEPKCQLPLLKDKVVNNGLCPYIIRTVLDLLERGVVEHTTIQLYTNYVPISPT